MSVSDDTRNMLRTLLVRAGEIGFVKGATWLLIHLNEYEAAPPARVVKDAAAGYAGSMRDEYELADASERMTSLTSEEKDALWDRILDQLGD